MLLFNKHLATTESIFRLIEYRELQHALQESKEARAESIKATNLAIQSIRWAKYSLWASIVSIIISTIISLIS